MQKIVLSSLIVLGLSGAAFAQQVTDFTTIDADTSGGVSLAEAQLALPGLTQEAFIAADVDVSGELSAEEFASLVATLPAT